MKFTLEDTAEIQKVEMKDEVPTGLLIINKNGEFLDKVTLLDHVKGTVEHLFEYVTGSLTDVTFDVFSSREISHLCNTIGICSNGSHFFICFEIIFTDTIFRFDISRLENTM